MTKIYTLESIGKSVDDLIESFQLMLKNMSRMNSKLEELVEENKTTNARLINHEDRISVLEESH